jgi:hypothetical protein
MGRERWRSRGMSEANERITDDLQAADREIGGLFGVVPGFRGRV